MVFRKEVAILLCLLHEIFALAWRNPVQSVGVGSRPILDLLKDFNDGVERVFGQTAAPIQILLSPDKYIRTLHPLEVTHPDIGDNRQAKTNRDGMWHRRTVRENLENRKVAAQILPNSKTELLQFQDEEDAEGAISFVDMEYRGVSNGSFVTVYLERTGGSRGRLVTEVSLLNGTAKVGTDFSPLPNDPTVLVWLDGDDGQNFVEIYVIYDATNWGLQSDEPRYFFAQATSTGVVSNTTVYIYPAPPCGQFGKAVNASRDSFLCNNNTVDQSTYESRTGLGGQSGTTLVHNNSCEEMYMYFNTLYDVYVADWTANQAAGPELPPSGEINYILEEEKNTEEEERLVPAPALPKNVPTPIAVVLPFPAPIPVPREYQDEAMTYEEFVVEICEQADTQENLDLLQWCDLRNQCQQRAVCEKLPEHLAFCSCPLDRYGERCEDLTGYQCDLELLGPTPKCVKEKTTSYNPDLTGDRPCFFVDEDQEYSMEYLITCAFNEGTKEGPSVNYEEDDWEWDKEYDFPYIVGDSTASFALSSEHATLVFRSKIFNMNSIFDKTHQQEVKLVTGDITGGNSVRFSLPIKDLTQPFKIGGRIYVEHVVRDVRLASGNRLSEVKKYFLDINGWIPPPPPTIDKVSLSLKVVFGTFGGATGLMIIGILYQKRKKVKQDEAFYIKNGYFRGQEPPKQLVKNGYSLSLIQDLDD